MSLQVYKQRQPLVEASKKGGKEKWFLSDDKIFKSTAKELQSRLQPDVDYEQPSFFENSTGDEKQSLILGIPGHEFCPSDMLLTVYRLLHESLTCNKDNGHPREPYIRLAPLLSSLKSIADSTTALGFTNWESSLKSFDTPIPVDGPEGQGQQLLDSDPILGYVQTLLPSKNDQQMPYSVQEMNIPSLKATGGLIDHSRVKIVSEDCESEKSKLNLDIGTDGAQDNIFRSPDFGTSPRYPDLHKFGGPRHSMDSKDTRRRERAVQRVTDHGKSRGRKRNVRDETSSFDSDKSIAEEDKAAYLKWRREMPHRPWSFAPPTHAYGISTPLGESIVDSFASFRACPARSPSPPKPVKPTYSIRESPFASYSTTPSKSKSKQKSVTDGRKHMQDLHYRQAKEDPFISVRDKIARIQLAKKESLNSAQSKDSERSASTTSKLSRKSLDRQPVKASSSVESSVLLQRPTRRSEELSIQNLQQTIRALQKDVASLKQEVIPASNTVSTVHKPRSSFDVLDLPQSSVAQWQNDSALHREPTVVRPPISSANCSIVGVNPLRSHNPISDLGGPPSNSAFDNDSTVKSRDFVILPSHPTRDTCFGRGPSSVIKATGATVQQSTKFKRAKKAFGRLFGHKALVVASRQPSIHDLKDRADKSIGKRIWNAPGRIIDNERGRVVKSRESLQQVKREQLRHGPRKRSKSQRRLALAKAYRVMAEVRAMEAQDLTPQRPNAKEVERRAEGKGEVRAKVKELLSTLKWKITGKSSGPRSRRRPSPSGSVRLPPSRERGRRMERPWQ